jgi:hypothetical protein
MLFAILLAGGLWDTAAPQPSPSCAKAQELRAYLAKNGDLPKVMRAGVEKKAVAAEADCNAAPTVDQKPVISDRKETGRLWD